MNGAEMWWSTTDTTGMSPVARTDTVEQSRLSERLMGLTIRSVPANAGILRAGEMFDQVGCAFTVFMANPPVQFDIPGE